MAKAIFAALILAHSAFAVDAKKSAPEADKITVELADYFLKVPLSEAKSSLVEPFLAVDAETLPAKKRAKVRAKQLEIRTLLKVHDRKKKGVIVQPMEGCTADSFVRLPKDEDAYRMAGFNVITEDEEKYVMEKTHCQELDLGCQFSLTILYDKTTRKPRKLMLQEKDPLWNLIAEYHGNGHNQTNFFGMGYNCQR